MLNQRHPIFRGFYSSAGDRVYILSLFERVNKERVRRKWGTIRHYGFFVNMSVEVKRFDQSYEQGKLQVKIFVF